MKHEVKSFMAHRNNRKSQQFIVRVFPSTHTICESAPTHIVVEAVGNITDMEFSAIAVD
jgi:hypothetical protein